jgi:flagellum-specific peptidoglycan hydrolase FlgJ
MDALTFYKLARGYKHINAFAATVQSALETGNWTSKLWVLARNGAGIKASTAWRDGRNDYILISSPEYRDGKYTAQNSYFRAYNSAEEFLADYALKIKNDYPHCTPDNVWGYFAGLYRGRLGKWATDHKYFEKLAKKAVQLEPVLLSQGHLKRALAYAIDKNYLEPWQIEIAREASK